MGLNAFTLSLKSLRRRPQAAMLSLLLMAAGIAMMSFAQSASHQFESSALRDAQGIDLVVGAKGSPLQLILSTVHHIDSPTGSIPFETQASLAQNRFVKKAIPLALGDNFEGFRIVGTNADYIAHYGGTLASGRLFQAPLEAVFGARAAAGTGTAASTAFSGTHGLSHGGEEHADTPLTAVGILKPTGTVLDRLILTPVESLWKIHEAAHDVGSEAREGRTAQAGGAPARELTALLIQYASPLAAASMPRLINSQGNLQAAQPVSESARLFSMLGTGVDVLRGIAALLLFAAGLSIFIALNSAFEERRPDFAILRALGAPPSRLLILLLTEGMILACGGAILGWLLGHGAVELLGWELAKERNVALSGTRMAPEEVWLALVALAIGFSAALLPALRACRTDIANTLEQQ